MKPLHIAAALLFFVACGSPKVVPMNGDTYLISARSAQVGFGPPEGLKAEIYQEANNFCATKGMVVETVSLDMVNSGFARPGSVALQFRCVSKPDPNTPKQTVKPAYEKSEIEKKLDELMKLKEKGLITQDEFDKKKKDILDKM